MITPMGGMMMSDDERLDDAAERSPDDDADRHVDDVATHREVFEFRNETH